MTVNLNMLGPFMKHWIVGVCIALVLLALRGLGPRAGTTSSQRNLWSQITSLLVEDMDLYSALAEDLEIVGFFLHFQKLREDLRDIHQHGGSSCIRDPSQSTLAHLRRSIIEVEESSVKSPPNVTNNAMNYSNTGLVRVTDKRADNLSCMR